MAGGGYTLYCDAGTAVGGNETVTGNQFSKVYFGAGTAGGSDVSSPGGGFYGPVTSCNRATVFSGNIWDEDGSTVIG